MAKGKREMSEKKIERWIKEGRGKGEGENYKPWLTIRDVPSQGISSRIKGWKTGRIHHVLSQLELHYLYTLEWSDEVTDIKEQYPLLPVERTIEIADSLGIKHPLDPKTQENIVMTTDFLINSNNSEGKKVFARTIKPSSELKTRTIEKFAIEQQFYKEQGIDWGIVTENERNLTFIQNMELIYNAKSLEYFPILNEEIIRRVTPSLYLEIVDSNEPLSIVTLKCDEKYGFKEGTCLFITKHMIANKNWFVDMNVELNPTNRVKFESDSVHSISRMEDFS